MNHEWLQQAKPKQLSRKHPFTLTKDLWFLFPLSKRMGSLEMAKPPKKQKNTNCQVIQNDPHLSPILGGQSTARKGHLTIPKRSQRIARCLIKKPNHNYLQQIITEHDLCCPILPPRHDDSFFQQKKSRPRGDKVIMKTEELEFFPQLHMASVVDSQTFTHLIPEKQPIKSP